MIDIVYSRYSALAELLPLPLVEALQRLELATDVDDGLRALGLVAQELLVRPLLEHVPASDALVLSTSLLRKLPHEEYMTVFIIKSLNHSPKHRCRRKCMSP
jgi:hypothetical protein